jgi:hypothetical protein
MEAHIDSSSRTTYSDQTQISQAQRLQSAPQRPLLIVHRSFSFLHFVVPTPRIILILDLGQQEVWSVPLPCRA